MRMMLLERLRKGVIDDEDFRFIAKTMQSLVYGTKAEMATAIHLTPRSLHRVFNDGDRIAPQQRIDIFKRYLGAVEAALAPTPAPRQKPRPRR
jgi:hypothetical protein